MQKKSNGKKEEEEKTCLSSTTMKYEPATIQFFMKQQKVKTVRTKTKFDNKMKNRSLLYLMTWFTYQNSLNPLK